MDIARGMRLRREAAGLTQGQLAVATGAEEGHIRDYETGGLVSLPMAATIAWALDCSVLDLTDDGIRRRGLSGSWWACWQTFPDGAGVVSPQPVEIDHRGDEVTMVAQGDARWRGALRLWDKKSLTGWYLTDGVASTRGSIYLAVTDGVMTGRWVGPGADGPVTTGWGTMARDPDASLSRLHELRGELHGGDRLLSTSD